MFGLQDLDRNRLYCLDSGGCIVARGGGQPGRAYGGVKGRDVKRGVLEVVIGEARPTCEWMAKERDTVDPRKDNCALSH